MAQIDHKKHGSLNTISVTGSFCWLSHQGLSLMEQLISLFNEIRSFQDIDSRILIFQIGPASDFDALWLDEVKRSLLRDELVRRVLKFRHLARMIQNFPHPVVYSGHDDCLDSHWELALACHDRLWLSHNAQVGFPLVSIGGFPPTGILNDEIKSMTFTHSPWHETPVMTARQAQNSNLIHRAIRIPLERPDSTAPQLDAAMSWARLRPDNTLASPQRETVKLEEFNAPETSADSATVSPPTIAHDSTWQAIWREFGPKMKAGMKSPSPSDGRAKELKLANACAQFLLRPLYGGWLARNICDAHASTAPASKNAPPKTTASPWKNQSVIVDCGLRPPPSHALASLLESDRCIAMCCPDASQKSTLEQIYRNLNNFMKNDGFSQIEFERFWHERVGWFLGGVGRSERLWIRWTMLDQITALVGHTEVTLDRLDHGHSLGAKRFVEVKTSANDAALLANQLAPFLRNVAGSFVFTRPMTNHTLSQSRLCQEYFMSEIFRVASEHGKSYSAILAGLRQQGWTLSDSRAWQDLEQRSPAHLRASKRAIDPPDFDPTSNHVRLHRHFSIFAYLLSLMILPFVEDGNAHVAQVITGRAVRFPIRLGYPRDFLQSFGRKRALAYAKKFWPEQINESTFAKNL